MGWLAGISVFPLLALASVVGIARARPDAPSSQVAFDAGQPTSFAGRIDAAGTFSVANKPALAVVSITLDCAPVQGGAIWSGKCKWKEGKWTGSISGAPAGKYSLKASMTAKDEKGKLTTWVTPILAITVGPAQPVARRAADSDR